ncbi:MAG: hypothetical protein U0166_09120 [Acidobacteriota bacterium]
MGPWRPMLSRTLQAFGLAVTLFGLWQGIAWRSMTGELSMLLVGTASFVLGRTLARGVS